MNRADAAQILRALAQGYNPQTRLPLTKESVVQQPEVIRALFVAVEALQSTEPGKQTHRTDTKDHQGQPWTSAEDKQLCERFDAGDSPKVLSQAHGRTRGAISARLVKLGKIEHRSMVNSARAASVNLDEHKIHIQKPNDGIPF